MVEELLQVDVQEEKSNDLIDIKEKIDFHFVTLFNLIKYTKEKDNNVIKINNTLQKYRDDYSYTLFKTIALNLIGFREDCRKSIKEFSNINLNLESVKKYLKYLYMDFEDLLANLNIFEKDAEWYYNNKNINNEEVKSLLLEEVEFEQELEIPQMEIKSIEDLYSYLKSIEEYLAEIIKTNKALDRTLTKYIEYTSYYEDGVAQVVLYPVIRKIIKWYINLKQNVIKLSETITEENCVEIYSEQLDNICAELEDILSECNVTIIDILTETYEPKLQKIIKIIPTEDENLHSLVSDHITDCYVMNEKVIYPQKVNVYRKFIKGE